MKSEERKIMKECKDGTLVGEKGEGNRIEKKKQRKSEKRKEKLVRECGSMVIARRISLQNKSLFERKSSSRRRSLDGCIFVLICRLEGWRERRQRESVRSWELFVLKEGAYSC